MTKPAFRLPLPPTTQHSAGMLLLGRNRGQTYTQKQLTCNFAIGFWGRLPIYNYGPRFSLFTHNCHVLGWRSRNYKKTRLSLVPVHFNLSHHFLNPFIRHNKRYKAKKIKPPGFKELKVYLQIAPIKRRICQVPKGKYHTMRIQNCYLGFGSGIYRILREVKRPL